MSGTNGMVPFTKSSKVTLNKSHIINKLCISGKLLSFSQLEILCLDTYSFQQDILVNNHLVPDTFNLLT